MADRAWWLFRSMALLLGALACAGCANLVASRVGSVEGMPEEWLSQSERVGGELFFESERVCIEGGRCLGLLRGPGHPEAESMNFQANIVFPDHVVDVGLELQRPGLDAFMGTVVLLHGYGASKETMAFSGMYFRFLGFDVLLPDLLGHGESDGSVGFGVHDALWIDQLLDEEGGLGGPVVLVGYSMGGVAALHLAQLRDDVAAVILLAPMLRFDEALVNFTRWAKPLGARWVPKSSLRHGAVLGLSRADLTLEQTDLSSLLANASVPVLMLASEDDRVSPHSRLIELESRQSTLIEVPERSHIGMAMIGTDEEVEVRRWLLDTVGLRRIPLRLDIGAGTALDVVTGAGDSP